MGPVMNLPEIPPPTTDPLHPAALAELLKVAESATPGPCVIQNHREVNDEYVSFLMPYNLHLPDTLADGDVAFLTAFHPTTAAALVRECQRLRKLEDYFTPSAITTLTADLAAARAEVAALREKAGKTEAHLGELYKAATGWGCGCLMADGELCESCSDRLAEQTTKAFLFLFPDQADRAADLAAARAEVGRLHDANLHYSADLHAAQADNAALREALEKACGVAVWMSGSADFSPDGKMGAEWPDQRDLLLSAIAVLRGPK